MAIIFLSSYIYKILPHRTLYGNEVYSKIHSFRRALQLMSTTTLKEKLENIKFVPKSIFNQISIVVPHIDAMRSINLLIE